MHSKKTVSYKMHIAKTLENKMYREVHNIDDLACLNCILRTIRFTLGSSFFNV
jgi:hypothetical protein